jgi:hypothetical protein
LERFETNIPLFCVFLSCNCKGFIISGCFGIISLSLNPITIVGGIITAIYVMFVLLLAYFVQKSRNTPVLGVFFVVLAYF